MAIFLDTGFFMGLVNPKDPHYKRSGELLNLIKTGKYGQIFTSTYILAETLTLVGVRTRNNDIAFNEIDELFKGDKKIARILRPDDKIESNTIKLFLKVNPQSKAKTISFVDCSNIIFCRKRAIDNILAYDRHFDDWLNRLF